MTSLKTLLTAAIVLLVGVTNAADLYTWSPAAPHHAAVCKVKSSDGKHGSGCLVRDDHFVFVLTAAHVVESSPTAEATFLNGTTVDGKVVISRDYKREGATNLSIDAAAILVGEVEGVEPLELYDGPIVSDIELCGYGGPIGELRHFQAVISGRSQSVITSTGRVTNGDSGGPWLHGGKVLGISSTGGDPIASFASHTGGRPFQVFDFSNSTATKPILEFVGRLHDKHCLVDS